MNLVAFQFSKHNSFYGSANIEWPVAGNIRNIQRGDTEAPSRAFANLNFEYDAFGNRLSKTVINRDALLEMEDEEGESTEFYVRDALGNVMAIYKRSYTDRNATSDGPAGHDQSETHRLQEQAIYGSSRIGNFVSNKSVSKTFDSNSITSLETGRVVFSGKDYSGASLSVSVLQNTESTTGKKKFELTNHLGNVLALIGNRKQKSQQSTQHQAPEVVNLTDYYPFGMVMPGRSYSADVYRYGFNGMEKDDELKGSGNSYDFGARMYDSRIGKWMSRDPLAAEYNSISPYAFAGNSPIMLYDPDGERIVWYRLRSALKSRKALIITETGREVWRKMRKSGTRIHLHYTKDVLVTKTRTDAQGNKVYALAAGLTQVREPINKVDADQSEEDKIPTNDNRARKRGTFSKQEKYSGDQYKKDKLQSSSHYKAVDIFISEGAYKLSKEENPDEAIASGDYTFVEVFGVARVPFGLVPNELKVVDAPNISTPTPDNTTYGFPDDGITVPEVSSTESLLQYLNRINVHEGTHSYNDSTTSDGLGKDENPENQPYINESKTIEQQ